MLLRRPRISALGLLLALSCASATAEALPAFPGAEGFGAGATGGRGGDVLKVTTLAPTGPGSLQAALDSFGPRIIVFDVSGVIEGDITIPYGDVTIAGQTAPGAGITIAGRLIADYDNAVSNVIVRHLRIRPMYTGSPSGDQFDGAQFSTSSNIILDHLSIAWGVDETLDLYGASNVTVQWSTIEEGATSGHPEGAHNYGLINGPEGSNSSIHHNLFIHQQNRNPAVASGPCEVLNNVAYNVRHGFVHHNPASGAFDIVGNSYIRGPDDELFPFYFDDEAEFQDVSGYYLQDNYIEDPENFIGTVDDPWVELVHPSFDSLNAPATFKSQSFYDFEGLSDGYVPVTVQSSADARDLVLEWAGAWPRDVVTKRVLAELDFRQGDWGVDAPDDLLEGLFPAAPPPDEDLDGMADSWELQNGLDPSDPSDHTTLMASGYSAIEQYINELARDLSGRPITEPDGVGGAGPGPGGPGPGPGSGGSGGAGGSGGSGGSTSSTSGGGGAGAAQPDGDDDDDGCAVRPGASASGVTGLSAMVVALAAGLRRRRRPQRQVRAR